MNSHDKLSDILDKATFVFIVLFCATSVFTIAGSQISIGFMYLTFLAKIIVSKNYSFKKTGLELPLLVFIFITILATIFSVRPQESFINLKNILLIPIFYVVGETLRTEKRLKLVIDTFVLFATIFSIYGIILFFLEITEKSMATQSTTMTWGAMSVFFIAFTFAVCLFEKHRIRRILYSFALLPLSIGLLFSFVRGSYVGAFFSVLLLVWLKSKRFVLLVLLILLLVIIVLPNSIQDRILSTFDPNNLTIWVRLNQWTDSIKMFIDRPILGFGWIDLGEIHRSYAPPGTDFTVDEYTIGHFHNNFVMILMSFGALGLIAFIWFIIKLIKIQFVSFRGLNRVNLFHSAIVAGSSAGFFGFLINGMFDWLFGDAEVATILWFSVGLLIAVNRKGISNHTANSISKI